MGSVTAKAFGPPEDAEEAARGGPSVPSAPAPSGFEEFVKGPRPLLVVVDSRGVVRNWRNAQAAPWYGGYVCLVSDQTPDEHLEYLGRRGVGVVRCGGGRVDLAEGLRRLYDEHGVRRVRTDGGGLLTGALLAAGLVDELIVMVAPTLCEEPRGRTLVDLQDRLPRAAARLELVDAETLEGGVVVLHYSVNRQVPPM